MKKLIKKILQEQVKSGRVFKKLDQLFEKYRYAVSFTDEYEVSGSHGEGGAISKEEYDALNCGERFTELGQDFDIEWKGVTFIMKFVGASYKIMHTPCYAGGRLGDDHIDGEADGWVWREVEMKADLDKIVQYLNVLPVEVALEYLRNETYEEAN